jgi:hypothetical protein
VIGIGTRHRQRVVEHAGGFLKCYPVLAEVLSSFDGVSFEMHVLILVPLSYSGQRSSSWALRGVIAHRHPGPREMVPDTCAALLESCTRVQERDPCRKGALPSSRTRRESATLRAQEQIGPSERLRQQGEGSGLEFNTRCGLRPKAGPTVPLSYSGRTFKFRGTARLYRAPAPRTSKMVPDTCVRRRSQHPRLQYADVDERAGVGVEPTAETRHVRRSLGQQAPRPPLGQRRVDRP